MKLSYRRHCLLYLLLAANIAGLGCSGGSNGPPAVTNLPPEPVELKGTTQDAEHPDPLIASMKAYQWDEFEGELRRYLKAIPKATAESDKKLTQLTEAIEHRISTADIGDRRFFPWRNQTARVILQSYKPLSTVLTAKLAGHLSSFRPFITGDRDFADTTDRMANAQLLLQTLNSIRERIDPNFDFDDEKNEAMVNVPVPDTLARYLPGTSPDSIVEPEIRQKYLLAIQRNNEKIEQRQSQRDARESEKKAHDSTLNFLRRAYQQPPAAFEELEAFLEELGVPANTKAEIISTARLSVPTIEKRVKESRENDEKLKQLQKEGVKLR